MTKLEKIKLTLLLLELILSVTGVIVLWLQNWEICLGVVLLVWGNNMMIRKK